MTKEEAIGYLRRYRREMFDRPSKTTFGWRLNYEFEKAVYGRFLIQNLINWIAESEKPPMAVVQEFYDSMDDILLSSENGKTWAFASIMENCTGDILLYLREIRRKR